MHHYCCLVKKKKKKKSSYYGDLEIFLRSLLINVFSEAILNLDHMILGLTVANLGRDGQPP